MEVDGLADVDFSLTTRELGDMIKQAGIDFKNLPDGKPDKLMGEGTGAGVIFGATGGVMEAALRTLADLLTEEDLPDYEYEAVRGLDGIKFASVVLPVGGVDTEVKVAVAHGTANAAKLLDSITAGETDVHFIEIMACPGGCIHGGGQSIVSAQDRLDINPKIERTKALFSEDVRLPERKSHKNEEVTALYEDFLGKPNGHLSHKLLHTHYAKKDSYPINE